MTTALITGASAGIGRAIALRLARAGYRLALLDVRPDSTLPGEDGSTEELCVKEGADARWLPCDVSDDAAVSAAFAALDEWGWQLDVLVNNAGIFVQARAEDLEPQMWHRLLGVNVDGYFHTIRAAIPRLRASNSPSIVNLSSVHGRLGIGRSFAYCTSKGAIENLTRQVAVDYAAEGIRCNAVAPGPIETAMSRPFREDPEQMAEYQRRVLLPRLGTPDDVAAVVEFLAGPGAGYVTGQSLVVDGGWSAA